MTWIRTISLAQGDEALRRAMEPEGTLESILSNTLRLFIPRRQAAHRLWNRTA